MTNAINANTNLTELARDFYQCVRDAQSEAAKKSLFEGYLQQAFGNDPEAISLINKILTGTEKTIFNIPVHERKRMKTGSADVQYENTIIEYEFSLDRTLEHTKKQFKEYFAGLYNSEQTINFNLMASYGIKWQIYAPSNENLASLKQFR